MTPDIIAREKLARSVSQSLQQRLRILVEVLVLLSVSLGVVISWIIGRLRPLTGCLHTVNVLVGPVTACGVVNTSRP
ncbi:hypothetical protein ACWDYH_39785 [Nocardia goodfellowii]